MFPIPVSNQQINAPRKDENVQMRLISSRCAEMLRVFLKAPDDYSTNHRAPAYPLHTRAPFPPAEWSKRLVDRGSRGWLDTCDAHLLQQTRRMDAVRSCGTSRRADNGVHVATSSWENVSTP